MSAKARINQPLMKDAMTIFQASLSAVDPAAAVNQALERNQSGLKVRQGNKTIKTLNLDKYKRVFLVGAGKATAPMAQSLEKILGDRLEEGLVTVKYGHGLDLKKTTVFEAAHPVPDQAGADGSARIVELLNRTEKDDLVFSLISGGGSALLPLPSSGIKLSEKQKVTQLLLNCGATIQEINAVRKHMSQVKGGQLARAAAPATVVNLMLSDVVGDDMDTIASGPFVPDRSTFEEVMVILAKYQLMKKIPASVRNHLSQGLTGDIMDTPKEGDPIFKNVTNVIVASNLSALKAAEAAAKEAGYKTLILSSSIEGETREVARVHAAVAKEILGSAHPVRRPACVISGGETTVTIKGEGKGGRNQEFALAAALDIDGLEDVLILSAGTDGTDGPTDAAGAAVDGTTCDRAAELNLSPLKHLDNNDAYPFFQTLDDLILTGPTRTNVMDVRLILVGSKG